MFGSIYRMRPRPGQEQAVADYYRRWNLERHPKVGGTVAAYVFKPRQQPGELMGVVVFDSEANYYKNADDPEQDRWYRQLCAASGYVEKRNRLQAEASFL